MDQPSAAEIGSPTANATGSEEEIYLRGPDGEFSKKALVGRAQHIFSQSTSYLETNMTRQWEKSLAHFGGRHAPGSKYTNQGFRRSSNFRPKTRAVVKSQEAGLATAMFSTTNLINVNPQNPKNEQQLASAAISKELLQHRLEHRMPWVVTVQGAYQDTKVYGVCISYQYWQLRETDQIDPAFDEDSGDPIYDEMNQRMGEVKNTVVEDKLCCDLIAPENFRFDPMCDWRKPAESSSYIIMVRPMRVTEAETMMEKNGGPWKNLAREQILSAGGASGERTRRAREGYERVDPAENQGGTSLATVWAHFNIVREHGEDWAYWTMGTNLLLSDPERLTDMCPWLRPGERPFVVGFSSLETHKTYPDGDVLQMFSLQEETNEVANQRIDNVRLSLNRRYHAKRGVRIDLRAMLRNTPGAVVYMDNPESDVKEITTPDVTSSSYREQEVLAQEMDQLVGGFDSAKAAQDGASPGGIARAGAVASVVQDYGVFLFVNTWVEPVLRQLLRLEQFYEMDETLLAVAADKANLFPRFGVDRVTDELLTQELILRVDAGIGTMDPVRKIGRLAEGMNLLMNIPGLAERVKSTGLADEVMGALGYASSERFFESDQEYEERMAQVEPQPTEIDVKLQELEIRKEDNAWRDERERLKLQIEAADKENERLARENRALEDRMVNAELAMVKTQTDAELAMMEDQTKRDIAAGQLSNKERETDVKSRQATTPSG